MQKSAGWSLIALIVLLTVALITLVGVGSAVAQGLRLGFSRTNDVKALYLAHAGVMDATAGYMTAGPNPQPQNWFPLGEFSVGTNEVFVRRTTNPERDFLLTDTSAASVQARGGGLSSFDSWRIQQVSSNKALTISALEVRWTGAAGAVQRVCLDANWNSGSCFTPPNPKPAAGALINIPDRPLDNTLLTNNHIVFTTNINPVPSLVIVVTFYMGGINSCPSDPAYPSNAPTLSDLPTLRQIQLTENCRRTMVYVDTDATQNWGLFTIRSIGEVRDDPFKASRALRTEFRPVTGGSSPSTNQIIAWREE